MYFAIKCILVLSHMQLFVTLWTAAYQAPLSMGFPGKNTGVRFHFLLQEIFPRDQTHIPCVSCITGWFFTTEPSQKSHKSPYLG